MERGDSFSGAQRGGAANRGRGRGNGQVGIVGRGGFQQPTFHPSYGGGGLDGRGRGRFGGFRSQGGRSGGRSFGGRNRGGFAGRNGRSGPTGNASAKLGQNQVGAGGMPTVSAEQTAHAAALLQQAFVAMQGTVSIAARSWTRGHHC